MNITAGMNLNGQNLTNMSIFSRSLDGTSFIGAIIDGLRTSGISGQPILPRGWRITQGKIVGPTCNLSNLLIEETLDLRDISVENANFSNSYIPAIINTNTILPFGWKIAPFVDQSIAYATSGLLIGPTAILKGHHHLNFSNLEFENVNFNNFTLGFWSKLDNVKGRKINFNNFQSQAQGWFIINGILMGPTANLENLRLSKISLGAVSLQYANLSNVVFDSVFLLSDLRNANLKNAYIKYTGTLKLPNNWTTISSITGNYAIGPDANLSGANLTYADMFSVNISGANLNGAILKNIRSSSVVSSEKTILPSGYKVLNGYIIGPDVNIEYIQFGSGYLENIDMKNIYVGDTYMNEITLRNIKSSNISGGQINLPSGYKLINGIIFGPYVNLNGSILNSFNLSNTNLTGAILDNAYMNNTNLSNAILDNISAYNINGAPSSLPSGWKAIKLPIGYEKYCLIGPTVNLSGRDLFGVNLSDSNLELANLQSAKLSSRTSRVNLSNTNLRNASLLGILDADIDGIPSKLPYGAVVVNQTLYTNPAPSDSWMQKYKTMDILNPSPAIYTTTYTPTILSESQRHLDIVGTMYNSTQKIFIYLSTPKLTGATNNIPFVQNQIKIFSTITNQVLKTIQIPNVYFYKLSSFSMTYGLGGYIIGLVKETNMTANNKIIGIRLDQQYNLDTIFNTNGYIIHTPNDNLIMSENLDIKYDGEKFYIITNIGSNKLKYKITAQMTPDSIGASNPSGNMKFQVDAIEYLKPIDNTFTSSIELQEKEEDVGVKTHILSIQYFDSNNNIYNNSPFVWKYFIVSEAMNENLI